MLGKEKKENFVVDLYIRVSTARQANEGDSLEAQENDLKKFCEYRGFHIYNTFIERGKSGGNTNRPEYQKLIDDINKERINAVVVKRLDRLSRSLIDFEQLIKLLQLKNVEFISLKENFDTTNAMGKAMLRVALVFAQLEREQTSERIRDIFEYRAKQGLYNGGNRPLGYINIDKELVPYHKEKEIVNIIFNKFIETRSSMEVTRYLNKAGYKDQKNKVFTHRQLDWILRNPTYIGKKRWVGQIYQGLQEPIISEKKFNQVQEILKKRRYISARSSSKALLQKLIICGECGSHMTPSYSYNHSHNKYYYYRCTEGQKPISKRKTCKHNYAPLKKAEDSVINALISLSQEKSFIPVENRILKYNQKLESEVHEIEKTISEMEFNLKSIEEKKEVYLDSLISSQFLSGDRDLIRSHISNLELGAKQTKESINTQILKRNDVVDDKIDITQFKKNLVTFKAEQENYSYQQLKEFIYDQIQEIIYQPDKLLIRFKLLPWEIEVDSNSLISVRDLVDLPVELTVLDSNRL